MQWSLTTQVCGPAPTPPHGRPVAPHAIITTVPERERLHTAQPFGPYSPHGPYSYSTRRHVGHTRCARHLKGQVKLKRNFVLFCMHIALCMLRRTFARKRDRVTGGWRKLHNEELHNLYSSPSIIRIRKSRRMR
jgi:hypothetical protein